MSTVYFISIPCPFNTPNPTTHADTHTNLLYILTTLEALENTASFCQTPGVGLEKALSVGLSVGLLVGRSLFSYPNQQGGSGIPGVLVLFNKSLSIGCRMSTVKVTNPLVLKLFG